MLWKIWKIGERKFFHFFTTTSEGGVITVIDIVAFSIGGDSKNLAEQKKRSDYQQ